MRRRRFSQLTGGIAAGAIVSSLHGCGAADSAVLGSVQGTTTDLPLAFAPDGMQPFLAMTYMIATRSPSRIATGAPVPSGHQAAVPVPVPVPESSGHRVGQAQGKARSA